MSDDNKPDAEVRTWSIKLDLTERNRGYIYPTNHTWEDSRNGMVIELSAYDRLAAELEAAQVKIAKLVDINMHVENAVNNKAATRAVEWNEKLKSAEARVKELEVANRRLAPCGDGNLYTAMREERDAYREQCEKLSAALAEIVESEKELDDLDAHPNSVAYREGVVAIFDYISRGKRTLEQHQKFLDEQGKPEPTTFGPDLSGDVDGLLDVLTEKK